MFYELKDPHPDRSRCAPAVDPARKGEGEEKPMSATASATQPAPAEKILSVNNIEVLYVAVDEKYSTTGILSDIQLTSKMIEYLKKIAKGKNIRTISLDSGTKSKTVIKV